MTDKDPRVPPTHPDERNLYEDENGPSLGVKLNRAITDVRNWVRNEIRSLRVFVDTTIEVKLSDVPDRIETLEGSQRAYDQTLLSVGADIRKLHASALLKEDVNRMIAKQLEPVNAAQRDLEAMIDRLSTEVRTLRNKLEATETTILRGEFLVDSENFSKRLKKVEEALSAPAFTKAMSGAIANAIGANAGLPIVTSDFAEPVDQPDGFADVNPKLLAKAAVRKHRTKARREHLTLVLDQLLTLFEDENRAVADVRFRMDPNAPVFDSLFIDASGRNDRTWLRVNVRDLVELAIHAALPK